MYSQHHHQQPHHVAYGSPPSQWQDLMAANANAVSVFPVPMLHHTPEWVPFDDTLPIQLAHRMTKQAWRRIIAGLNARMRPHLDRLAVVRRSSRNATLHMIWSSILTMGLSMVPICVYLVSKTKEQQRVLGAAMEAARAYLREVNQVWEPAGVQLVLRQRPAPLGHRSRHPSQGLPTYWIEVAWGHPPVQGYGPAVPGMHSAVVPSPPAYAHSSTAHPYPGNPSTQPHTPSAPSTNHYHYPTLGEEKQ